MTTRRAEPPVVASRSGDARSGFSLVEVLVAGAILLVIALGLIPIYARSIRSNVEGFDFTRVSNSAKSRAEEYLQYEFNGPLLTLPGGQDELEVQDFFSELQRNWVASIPAGDTALFTRTTTIRQFHALDTETPLPGGTPLNSVHLKEITVTVEGSRVANSPLGPGKRITVRVFKAQ